MKSCRKSLLGTTTRHFQMIFVALLLSSSGVGAASDENFSFDALMAALGNNSAFSSQFVETRSSIFLSKPIELYGTIIFDADQAMEKIIEKPFFEHFIINSEFIVVHRKNVDGKSDTTKTIQYSLVKYPFLAKAISGVSNLFAGDRLLLDELYHSTLSGTKNSWKLVLEPKDVDLSDFISSITVYGSKGEIQRIHTLEADGDESDMILSDRKVS